ncbi:hypothetical protein KC678_00535 [Candidatus Dojkabacteria bacterium]|uniref:Uncharacterized protein n=1 Tax=Candidatus Dojkabacteria bacterium TaxID=2099670 RepID=A0A955IAF1_9BACT|nr:hypothetical protein [Candidatus Dojkabacteria bacterium]
MHSKQINTKKGSVALTTVIVLMGILTLGAITLILNTIDANRVNKNLGDYAISDLKAISCVEEGILKVKQDNNYTGNFNVTIDGEEQCDGSVNDLGGQLRQLIVNASNESTNFYREYTIDISTSPFTVTF